MSTPSLPLRALRRVAVTLRELHSTAFTQAAQAEAATGTRTAYVRSRIHEHRIAVLNFTAKLEVKAKLTLKDNNKLR
eukprot:2437922-Rhodomonas_salina.1